MVGGYTDLPKCKERPLWGDEGIAREQKWDVSHSGNEHAKGWNSIWRAWYVCWDESWRSMGKRGEWQGPHAAGPCTQGSSIWIMNDWKFMFGGVQSLSVHLSATTWTAASQASLFITSSRSLLKFMFIESVMPSNHLILCHPPSLPVFNLSQHQSLF